MCIYFDVQIILDLVTESYAFPWTSSSRFWVCVCVCEFECVYRVPTLSLSLTQLSLLLTKLASSLQFYSDSGLGVQWLPHYSTSLLLTILPFYINLGVTVLISSSPLLETFTGIMLNLGINLGWNGILRTSNFLNYNTGCLPFCVAILWYIL